MSALLGLHQACCRKRHEAVQDSKSGAGIYQYRYLLGWNRYIDAEIVLRNNYAQVLSRPPFIHD
jgi:hypothetical protein